MKLSELLTHYFDLASRGVRFTSYMREEIEQVALALENRVEALERQVGELQHRTLGLTVLR